MSKNSDFILAIATGGNLSYQSIFSMCFSGWVQCQTARIYISFVTNELGTVLALCGY
jgi:hypothetical protein